MGYFFNQPVVIPKALTTLTKGSNFNQPLKFLESLCINL
jgi:hypothetical protein